MIKTLNVYLQRRKARQLVGKLFREGKKFIFEYEESYRLSTSPLSLGPDLPLHQARHSSLKLFPSFKDRLPSRQNPAYENYCRSNGISPNEKDPLVLLAALGQKGPGSFIVTKAPPSHDFSNSDLKQFRKGLRLSIREFAQLFDVSVTGLYRVENGRSSGAKLLKEIKIYRDRPEMALHQLKLKGAGLSDFKRQFVEYELKSKLSRLNTFPCWTVKATDIQQCGPDEATQLLRRLLLAECTKYNIPQSQVQVSGNIAAPDGGQDGLVAWLDGIERTHYLPKRYNCFQMKAKALKPSECEKEILNKKGELKPAIINSLKQRGAYILCSTHPYSGVYISLREEKLYETLEKAFEKNPRLRGKLSSLEIKFYDAHILANWLNSHPPIALWFLKEVCKKPISSSWRLWSEWSLEAINQPKYRLNTQLKRQKQLIYACLLRPRSAVHLTGASGLGKTRLALEAFRPVFKESVFTEKEGGYLEKPDRSHLVLYSSAAELSPKDVRELKPERAILIIDDCSAQQAEAFRRIALEEGSQLSLLTITCFDEEVLTNKKVGILGRKASAGHLDDPSKFPKPPAEGFTPAMMTAASPDRASFCQIKLEPDEEIVKQMLAQSSNIKNLYFPPSVLRLTQGWPLMAQLLLETDEEIKGRKGRNAEKPSGSQYHPDGQRETGLDGWIRGHKPFNKPSEWIQKMLFGREGREDPASATKTIKACALFDTLAIEDEKIEDEKTIFFNSNSYRGRSESEYIARVIGKLDYDTFYRQVQFFKNRQIIQQRGRFIQVRPKPLALWLAAQFIKESPPESILQWLEGQSFENKGLENKEFENNKGEQQQKLKALHSDKTPKDPLHKKAYLIEQREEAFNKLNGLREAFCRQMASFTSLAEGFYQSEEDEAELHSKEDDLYNPLRESAKKLIASGGLFARPEVLGTEWGTSCFFYLARLCPQTALQTLEKTFGY